MDNNTQHSKGRKWQITINNPEDYNLNHEEIKNIISKMKLDYWCMCDEIGLENKTPHTHLYIYKKSTIRFDTIKNKFPKAHIEWCYGTSKENRDYVRKEGKYADTDKKETNLIDTFEEFGDLPNDTKKTQKDAELLQQLIDEGYTNEEIVRQYPQFNFKIKQIDELRYTLIFSKYKKINRTIKTYYLYGKTATGKSQFVHSNFEADDLYIVSDYDHPFDNYMGQPVIVFEEFRSSLKYSDMLQYLDKYPCQLGARYSNKWACYIYAFIISNIPLEEQYKNKFEDENSKEAFYRRIDGIFEFKKDYYRLTDEWKYKQEYYLNLTDYQHGIESDAPAIQLYKENTHEN